MTRRDGIALRTLPVDPNRPGPARRSHRDSGAARLDPLTREEEEECDARLASGLVLTMLEMVERDLPRDPGDDQCDLPLD